MEEVKFKEIVALNLIKYRKANNLTQLEVAEKLNYSDKAISKWERGESLPDLYTLSQLAALFGVSIDALCQEDEVKVEFREKKTLNHTFITLLSVGIVWVIATILFVIANIIPAINLNKTWLVFIFAIPVASIVFTVFAAKWFNLIIRCLAVSGIVCGCAVSLFFILKVIASNTWVIFLVAGVLEILVILWYFMLKYKKK